MLKKTKFKSKNLKTKKIFILLQYYNQQKKQQYEENHFRHYLFYCHFNLH